MLKRYAVATISAMDSASAMGEQMQPLVSPLQPPTIHALPLETANVAPVADFFGDGHSLPPQVPVVIGEQLSIPAAVPLVNMMSKRHGVAAGSSAPVIISESRES